jgi:LPXTG-site transpeptidase (sortase) family protein
MDRTQASDAGSGKISRAGRSVAALVVVALFLGAGGAASAEAPPGSTDRGGLPTTGGARPGPLGSPPSATPGAIGVRPRAIRIATIGVDAQIETVRIVDGVMENPTGPWVVSWYRETATLGEVGNTVLAGHLDYWDVGPAVFHDVGRLRHGDRIAVTGDDGRVYTYEVDWVKRYDAASAPIQTIVGPTPTESLTLITCGGPFDAQQGVYLQRTVVRAHRVTD